MKVGEKGSVREEGRADAGVEVLDKAEQRRKETKI